eukprot:13097650-Alexandrium_andersonii.AAC.1
MFLRWVRYAPFRGVVAPAVHHAQGASLCHVLVACCLPSVRVCVRVCVCVRVQNLMRSAVGRGRFLFCARHEATWRGC